MENREKIVFYELNPRFFKDSTNSGSGDINGVIEKFDYFDFLGVDAIVLQNVLESNDKEMFESHFKGVDENAGHISDFKKLVAKAKEANIKLLIDFNVGAIHENSKLFTETFKTYGNRYIETFAEEDQRQDVEYKKFRWNEKRYVYDSKTQEVPLNWKADVVSKEFKSIIDFWINQGIDGFVFKGFEFIGDYSKTFIMNDHTLEVIRHLYKSIKQINDELIVAGKSSLIPSQDVEKFVYGDLRIFDYLIDSSLSMSGISKRFGVDAPTKFKLRKFYKQLKSVSDYPANVISFNSAYVGKAISRWANDNQFQVESAKTLALLQFLTKASSSIYYGDEIGMPNIGLNHLDDFQTFDLEERRMSALKAGMKEDKFMQAQVENNPINARALMQWNSEKNAGFSNRGKTITPVGLSYKEINVDNQIHDKASPLMFYRKLIKLIKTPVISKIINEGQIKISRSFKGIIKYIISTGYEKIVLLVNLSNKDKKIPQLLEGQVLLSSYFDKKYSEMPSMLEAYESVLIYIHQQELEKIVNENAANSKEETKKVEKVEKKPEAKVTIEEVEIKKEVKLKQESQVKKEQVKDSKKTKEVKVIFNNKKTEKELEVARRNKERAERIKARMKADKERERQLKKEEMKIANKQEKEAYKKKPSKIDQFEIERLKEEEKRMKEEIKASKKELTFKERMFPFMKNKVKEDKVVREFNKEGEKDSLEAIKESVIIEQKSHQSHLDEKTKLKEADIAKTTLIDDSIDLDELFGE